jgi:hypothetical protein
MPDPGPFGETFFEASVLAMVAALFVNKPAGGCVESVLTFRIHFLFAFVAAIAPPWTLLRLDAKTKSPAIAGRALETKN